MAPLAMFPLGSVLFPGAMLPLHVFEPRYRELVRDCLASEENEFGVALITRGSEVGGGDVRSMVATVTRMVQVAELDDGRYAVITVGIRRVRVDHWLPDDPYPRANVTDWPDEFVPTAILDDHLERTFANVRRVNALAAEMGHVHGETTAEISRDVVLASYQLSALAPLGPADQQRLLEAPGPADRLLLLDTAIGDVEALLQFRLQHEIGGEMPEDVNGP